MITRASPVAQRILLTVSKAWWVATFRLASVVACVGLTTSRLGLILHELLGHGGTAIAFGGEITDFRLFWFGGGWIRYDFEDPTREALITISVGGLAVEIVIGVALWLLIRKDGLAHRLLRAAGAALVIHAAWYFATGTWYGYGDGTWAYKTLGDWRYPAAIVAGLIACGAAFLAARLVLGALAALVPGNRRAQLAGLALAGVLAVGFHGGLTVAELAVRDDRNYGAMMGPQRQRTIAREYATWERQTAARGVAISDAERDAELRRLAARHPSEPPLLPVLLAALAISIGIGVLRARAAPADSWPRRLELRIVVLAVGSIGLVIAIDQLFH